MFIAQSTTQIALRKSAMSSAESDYLRIPLRPRTKSAVDPLHGTPTELNMVRGRRL